MKPGTRVLRGPDWCNGNKDGGIGFLGTVTKVFPDNTVQVTWDIGTEMTCRAGKQDAFDLRIFDNAQLGVRHGGVTCDIPVHSRGQGRITGIRWKCLVCNDYDECTNCYNGIGHPVVHDTKHAFVRINMRKSTVVRVPPRRNSKRVPIYGLFPEAKVTKAITLSKNKDISTGIIREVIDVQYDSWTYHRGGVRVEWTNQVGKKRANEDGTTNLSVYRVGAEGKVELKLLEPVSPGSVYIDHLPVLDLTRPTETVFAAGDTVRIDQNLETFKAIQSEYGGWVSELEEALGEEGRISQIKDENRRIVSVRFDRIQKEFDAISMHVLTKVTKINSGDTVRVTDDERKMKNLQAGHGGWQQAYISILGKIGHVMRIDDNDALVDIDGDTFVLNPECLSIATEPVQENKGDKLETLSQGKGLLRSRSFHCPVPSVARRSKPPPGVSADVGIRVVRGPDWSPDFEDQDGGEGHVGSLVEISGQSEDDMYPKHCVVVQWDNGERNVYRAGYEKSYDLRILDNAGIGIKHDKPCTECKCANILGLLWRSQQSPGVNICSDCYGNDKQDINHSFTRIDYPGDEGTGVPKRAMSRKIAAKGIFERSRVQRGPDWRWQNQDGGVEKEGEVIAIVNFSPDTDHDAAEVTWQNGYTNVYRLGYKGRLDIKCVKPASGGFYYKDHLPILKLDNVIRTKPETTPVESTPLKPLVTEPASPAQSPSPKPFQEPVKPTVAEKAERSDTASATPGRFKNGDRVRIEIDVDILKMIEENRGAWNEHMTECIGKTGNVLVSKGADVTVDFEDVGRWTFHESVLNKVKEFVPGETVKVKDSVDNIRMLQTERGGWNEMMAKVAGHRGSVEEVDEDGDVVVNFGGYTWTFNPECLVETSEEPEFLTHSDEPEDPRPPTVPSTDRGRPPPATEDEKLEEFFGTIFAGESERVGRIIQRDPQLMLMEFQGEFAIHQASQCGNIDIVKTLLQTAGKDSQLEMPDSDGNTPLLKAVKGGHTDMIDFLVQERCKKDVANKNSETAVHIAIASKNIPLLRKLRDMGFDINKTNELDQSPIFDAILSGDDVMLTVILEWPGLDVTSVDSIGVTPFMAACRQGNKRGVLGILEIAPRELLKPKGDGNTGLHLAVMYKQTEIVQVLLSQPGIDVNVSNKKGRSPLHVACEVAHMEILKILLEKGANLSMVDVTYKTCLHVLAESTGAPDTDEKAVLDLARFLLAKGVQPDARDSSGKPALEYVNGQLKGRFAELVTEFSPRPDTGRPRGSSDPPQSLPANYGSRGRSDIPEGPASMLIPQSGGQSNGTQGQGQARNQSDGEVDPEFCEVCDEEPIRFRLEPCRHLLCGDCRPAKKAKRKLCGFCGEQVAEIVEFDTR